MKTLLLLTIGLQSLLYANPYELTEKDLMTLTPDQCYEKALKYREFERLEYRERVKNDKILVSTYTHGNYWKRTYKQVSTNQVIYTSEDSNGEKSTYIIQK